MVSMDRRRSLFVLVVWVASLVLIEAGGAMAIPAHGSFVDATCTSNEFVPARPFNPNGGNPNDPSQANCGLCHANASSPNGALNAAGDQFRRSGHNDVSPFCAPPVVNRPPVFTAIPFQLAMAGALLELQVAARDPEGGPVLLSASDAPPGSTFVDGGNGSGLFRWRPGASDLGTHLVRFHAADTGSPMAVRALDVFISVGPASNLPPELAPIGNLQVELGDTLAFTLVAQDPDGQAVVFSASPLPTNASLSGDAFSFAPDAAQVGQHAITFTVTDSGSPPASDSETVVITVGRTNRPPVLAPIGDREIEVGAELMVALSASDPDGDALAFACSGLPAEARLDDRGDGSAALVWRPSSPARFRVACSVTDSGTPAASALEAFALAAIARDADPETPILSDALWRSESHDGSGKLRVVGRLTSSSLPSAASSASPPPTPLDVYGLLEDGTSVLLGSRIPSPSHVGFRVELEPFLAPCEVAVARGPAMSEALVVRNAPSDCGDALRTRVDARIGCGGDCLKIVGRRGPIGGMVFLRDAETGETLMKLPVQSLRGRFRGRVEIAGPPRALLVEVEQGGRTWSLARPVAVSQRGERCDDSPEDARGDARDEAQDDARDGMREAMRGRSRSDDSD